jgi:hypothetical protein
MEKFNSDPIFVFLSPFKENLYGAEDLFSDGSKRFFLCKIFNNLKICSLHKVRFNDSGPMGEGVGVG